MRVFGLAVVVGALSWLAGCSTAPQSESAPVASGITAAQAPALPVNPGVAVIPAEAPTDDPINDMPRPALLAGEPAREFARGGASWYGPGFHGRRTASGERYDMNALTAAHRTLPFGTWVRVHSLVNGRQVDVRITDRGPFSRNRVIDVSRAAARELDMLGLGFKEVVLLVPESTDALVDLPVVKGRRVVQRGARVR